MQRPIKNLKLAKWIAASVRNQLSFMVNNNPQGVITYLQARGAQIQDTNGDGHISAEELFNAIEQYAQQHFGSIKNFIDEAGQYIHHNDGAPLQWNLYRP